MKTNYLYIKPEIEIIEIESEGVCAGSVTLTSEEVNESRVKRRDFWSEN